MHSDVLSLLFIVVKSDRLTGWVGGSGVVWGVCNAIVGQAGVVHPDGRVSRIDSLGVLGEDILAVQSLDGVLVAGSDRVVIRAGCGDRVGGCTSGTDARDHGGGQDDKLRGGKTGTYYRTLLQRSEAKIKNTLKAIMSVLFFFSLLRVITNALFVKNCY